VSASCVGAAQSLFDFERAVRDFQALLESDASDRQWNRRLYDARSLRDLTHYHVLGVPQDADAAALKKAYRQLCLRWHPDKHTSSVEDQQRANTAFRRINEAYDVLSDTYKRMLYDIEKRPVLLASEGRQDMDGFDKWFQKVSCRARQPVG
jgi:DnaJ-class molecular chaperone